ncbi:MAG TPA: hypothetical protein VEQ65_12700, partial [Opitutus sp.]|nr:hypothetical protein [Opitutus sp.]
MADALAALPAASPEIAVGLSTFADQTLCRYRIGAEAFAMTAEEFRATFNQWFIRRIPRDIGALRRAAEDMVVEELDFREARARGIDRTAQFVEDRRGFGGFHVLDLFEREVLQPKLKIDAAAVERSYGERAAEFVEITRIRGRLAEFATPDAAGAWMGQMNPVASRPPSSAPQRETELVVERDKPILGLEAFHSMLFASEVGAPLGPWQRGNAWVVFVKSEDLERSLIPLAAVAPRIRADLERAALDAELLRLAQELAPGLKIENAIDHAEFGGQERPWSAALPR